MFLFFSFLNRIRLNQSIYSSISFAKKMFDFDELPNELYLIIFSYFKKYQLIQSFYQLNRRINYLIIKYFLHINLSTKFPNKQFKEYLNIQSFISSLTIESNQIEKSFLNQIQLDSLNQIKLIDSAIDLQEYILDKFQPETLHLVFTSLNELNRNSQINFQSLKKLELEFYIGEYAKNYLLNEINIFSPSILVNLRMIFSKLSEYLKLFSCQFSNCIEKVSVSIFSIDQINFSYPKISLPYLNDFQLEICQISFDLIKYLLPETNSLKRFAFIGQTTTINAKLWKDLLETRYHSIEHFDLHLSNINSIQFTDIQQWKSEFPNYSIDYNDFNHIFRLHSSKFDFLERIYLNESIENLNHIEYSNKISHLIIRSEYWCSYIHLSIDIQKDLIKRFHLIKHLSTTSRQLDYFSQTKFLNQIEQLDLEFSEKYCSINNQIAEQLIHLKSLSLSSIYDGIHQINLHTIIKQILLKQFPKIIYLYIDAIEITDEEQVENSISQWYSSEPLIQYIQGKYLSIWF